MFGIWAGVRPAERKRVVEELGHGEEAVSAILAIGERTAREYPGDPAEVVTHRASRRAGGPSEKES
jgi:hypothetical protein